MKRSYLQHKPTHKGFKRPTLADLRKPDRKVGFGMKKAGSGLRKAQKAIKAKRDPKLAAWGREVRKRDGNRCQWPAGCKTGDTRIDPHHKMKRSQRPDQKYNVDVGVCLCRTHHQWTDDHHDEAVAMGLLDTTSYEISQKERRAA